MIKLKELQTIYLNKRHQFILLNGLGQIIESSNSLVNLFEYYHQSIFDVVPFFESIRSEIFSVEENSNCSYNCIGMNFAGKQGVYDVIFFKSEETIVCVLEDRAENYQHWLSIQQERNDTIVDRELIEAQTKIIEEKSKEINESIQYAKRIQEVVMPKADLIKELLPNSFVFYLPKDVVSGDFYWVAEKNNRVFFTPADATGHGVPGALMSMIGNSLLNEAVLNKEIIAPNEILYDVRSGIINTLKQDDGEMLISDGFDAAICAWDREKNVLEYAGANNPLLLVRDGKRPPLSIKNSVNSKIKTPSPVGEYNGKLLYEIKPDKFPVGVSVGRLRNFTNHEFQLYKGDTLYTFSDGYQDQFGGGNNRRFTSKRFKELLLSIYDEKMEQQAKILLDIHNGWKEDGFQVDDICVIGVRI